MFSEAELTYLDDGGKLGRLATVDSEGAPHVVPVGWNYNPATDTIDVGGHDFARTRKFRNVVADPKVCFVVDDVLPPWHPRCVQVRGQGAALDTATWPDGTTRDAIIRITPSKVVSWGLE
ncbi:MAG: PPOX class F420-dependent oxidoreductase [Pseudonocardiaceae bacterium]|nr:PPOX class F420-dependent oxidoreductase [Pseudonocardiaceae bacterium]